MSRRILIRIETEEHRHVYAAERLSQERDETLEAGSERRAAVEDWLAAHPEVVVGAEVAEVAKAVAS